MGDTNIYNSTIFQVYFISLRLLLARYYCLSYLTIFMCTLSGFFSFSFRYPGGHTRLTFERVNITTLFWVHNYFFFLIGYYNDVLPRTNDDTLHVAIYHSLLLYSTRKKQITSSYAITYCYSAFCVFYIFFFWLFLFYED